MNNKTTNDINTLKSKSRFLTRRIKTYRKAMIKNNTKIRVYARKHSEAGITMSNYALVKAISILNPIDSATPSIYSSMLDIRYTILKYCKDNTNTLNNGTGIIQDINNNIEYFINNYNINNCNKIMQYGNR